jgi:hypothetical protein
MEIVLICVIIAAIIGIVISNKKKVKTSTDTIDVVVNPTDAIIAAATKVEKKVAKKVTQEVVTEVKKVKTPTTKKPITKKPAIPKMPAPKPITPKPITPKKIN